MQNFQVRIFFPKNMSEEKSLLQNCKGNSFELKIVNKIENSNFRIECEFWEKILKIRFKRNWYYSLLKYSVLSIKLDARRAVIDVENTQKNIKTTSLKER